MKKLVFTLGLCLVTVVSFGQKKVVNDALKLAKDAKPNFVEARTKITAALQHEETKNDAKTWYTAGQIENLQFDKENTKQILGQQPNETVMYEALYNIFPFFEKAYELDKLPDAKGNVKPKFAKDMKSIMKANIPHYINGGAYFFDQSNNQKAFEFFDQLMIISDSPLMKDGEVAGALQDSNYIFANYYAAIASMTLDHETAVRAMTRASKSDFKQNDVFQILAQNYLDANDTENFEKTLEEGLALYPKDQFFLMHLVNIYLDSDRNDKALENTLTAIRLDPMNDQLYTVAGIIYERSYKDNEKAEEHFKKAIEIDGENAESQSNLGRIYYNQGVNQLDIANEIADVQKYNEERNKAKDFFRQALPYYEKAFQLNPETLDVKIALRGIYYNLDMGDKLNEIDKLMDE